MASGTAQNTRKRKTGDERRTAIIVLGMHRSGTSALTRVLSLLGCDLPKTLMRANHANEVGYWESDAIYRLNDRILESAGSAWNDWLEFNPDWFDSAKADEFRDEAIATIAEEFGSSRLFVVKDPRNCRLLPFWLDVFDRCNISPLAFLPVRNPLEVAASLERRDGFEPGFGHLLWLRHVLEAEYASRGIPRLVTTYDQLMQAWPSIARNAQTKLGLKWPRLSDRSADEIEAFLSDEFRHHKKSAASVLDNPTLSTWLRETYATAEKWAHSGEVVADRAGLDRVRRELNAASPAFGRLVAAGHAARQAAVQLEHRLSEETGKRNSAEQLAAANEQKAGLLQQELDAALQRAEAARAEAEHALSELRHSLAQTQSALAQRSLEAEETASALKQARAEAAAERDQRARRDEELAALRRELAETQARSNAELATLRIDLERAANDQQQLERQVKERFAEIATLTRMLSETESKAHRKDKAMDQMRLASARQMGQAITSLLESGVWSFMPAHRRLRRKIELLKRSGLFDAEWYLRHYTDVADAGFDPLIHYVVHGVKEGREPNSILAELKSRAG